MTHPVNPLRGSGDPGPGEPGQGPALAGSGAVTSPGSVPRRVSSAAAAVGLAVLGIVALGYLAHRARSRGERLLETFPPEDTHLFSGLDVDATFDEILSESPDEALASNEWSR